MILVRRLLSSSRLRDKIKRTEPIKRAQTGSGPYPKRVILFIGQHKVGSTSLQDFFARNAAPLAQSGILYPFVDFQGMSYQSATGSGRMEVRGSLAINIREPHNALAFRMLAHAGNGKVPAYHKGLPALTQMENAIRQQIKFLEPHTMVLAAEVFSNFAAQAPEMIDRLLGLFNESEVTLVATFRRIDEYIASWHGQRLKFGHVLPPLSHGVTSQYGNNIHFDYRLMMERWIAALPKAKLVLRDYADARSNGGTVADVIDQTGLKLPEGLAKERHENESIHRALYEIVRRANTDLPGPKARLLRREAMDVTDVLGLPPSSDVELFGGDVRKQMVDQFAPINTWLGAQAGRADGFFSDLDAARQTLPASEPDIARKALEQLVARWPRTGEASDLRAYLETLDLTE